VKRVFEDVFKAMVELFRQGMRRKAAGDRQRALVMAGICVGGMVVARGLADRKFADSLRSAAMAFALGLGRWPGGHAGIPVRRSPRRSRIASR